MILDWNFMLTKREGEEVYKYADILDSTTLAYTYVPLFTGHKI